MVAEGAAVLRERYFIAVDKREEARMSGLKLVIANKNYSSWSMRPWVLLKQAGIAFEEVQLKFTDEGKVGGVQPWSPTGKVPVLWINDEPVWDSLAICETIAELYPEQQLWPADIVARRVARSISAEMHSGLRDLRSGMPMNIRSSHPDKGRTPGALKDIQRIVAIWESCRARFGAGGEMLFGDFSCADAMFAPVVTRFKTYAVSLPPAAQRYADAVLNLTSVREWYAGALAEKEFVPADEPYVQRP
jgi:glutathione S-transferase